VPDPQEDFSGRLRVDVTGRTPAGRVAFRFLVDVPEQPAGPEEPKR
jgi:hypothetical protein